MTAALDEADLHIVKGQFLKWPINATRKHVSQRDVQVRAAQLHDSMQVVCLYFARQNVDVAKCAVKRGPVTFFLNPQSDSLLAPRAGHFIFADKDAVGAGIQSEQSLRSFVRPVGSRFIAVGVDPGASHRIAEVVGNARCKLGGEKSWVCAS